MERPIAYNPAFLSDDELRRRFVVRKVDLDLLVEIVGENTNAKSNQHVLVVGARGLGKTMLALGTAAEVRKRPKLARSWYPLVFAEESYEIGSPGELWLEGVFRLANQTGDERYRTRYQKLRGERDDQRLYEGALATLMDFADEQKKRLLVVIENLHMVFGDQLGADAADRTWTIRHTLQNEPRIMLLGTATARFDETERSDRAMYDLFRVFTLKPLDTDECRELWKALTGQVLAGLQIRPVEILTGGNPRLVTILSSFSRGSSLRSLVDDLAQLVDEHTSYFKSNLESLAPLERKVFVALADIWRPALAREVAEAARLDVSMVSSLLSRLVKRGEVQITEEKSRSKRYQVAERLYNIYHLMRREGKGASPVRWVLDFMFAFYDPISLAKLAGSIADEAVSLSGEASVALAVSLGSQGRWADAFNALRPAFSAANSNAVDVTDFIIDAARAGESERALAALGDVLSLGPTVVALQMHLGREVNAPQEVVEVARDVLARIQAKS